MTITDEMIERGCIALCWARTLTAGLSEDDMKELTPEIVWEDVDVGEDESVQDKVRAQVRAVLEAALC
jgi:hypothetical protein